MTRPPRRHTVDSDTDSLDMPHDALLRDAHTPESQTTELDDMLTELEKSVNSRLYKIAPHIQVKEVIEIIL